MDAKTLFGYVMLYRVQSYLHVVVDEVAAELIQEHRYNHFVMQDGFDVEVAQMMEEQLNTHISAAYVAGTPFEEWVALTRAAHLRAAMNAKFATGVIQ